MVHFVCIASLAVREDFGLWSVLRKCKYFTPLPATKQNFQSTTKWDNSSFIYQLYLILLIVLESPGISGLILETVKGSKLHWFKSRDIKVSYQKWLTALSSAYFYAYIVLPMSPPARVKLVTPGD